jgi:hypothetical protein
VSVVVFCELEEKRLKRDNRMVMID